MFVFFKARSFSAEFCYFIKLAFLVVAGRSHVGDGGLHPESVASSAVPVPAWEPGTGERRVLHARGRGECSAGLGAGVKDPGWVGRRARGATLPPRHGWESPGSRLCRRGAREQSPFSSSLLPASPVPAPKGEGRKEGEHPSQHGSRPEPGRKPTLSPGQEPAYAPGKGK